MDHLMEAAVASLGQRQTVEGKSWEDSDSTLGDPGKLEIGTCPRTWSLTLVPPAACPSPHHMKAQDPFPVSQDMSPVLQE